MLDEFFKILINLKFVQRKGWKEKLSIASPESVADHSFSMASMAMVLSDLHGLNTQKIVKMSLLHDLAESTIGDFTPNEISAHKKRELENSAMENILKHLPKKLSKKYNKIWEEYQFNKSKEAIFVHELDKLEMAFHANKLLNDKYPKDKMKEFFDTAEKEIKNIHLRKLLSNLY